MKYFGLVWSSLFRSKLRTFLTMFSVLVAFMMFGLLNTVRDSFINSGKSVEGANRMIVSSKLSLTQMLPTSLENQIQAVPGVSMVTTGSWFGGIYQDPKNFFANFAVSPNYFELYPDTVIDKKAIAQWQTVTNGAIVGEPLMKRFGWKVGQEIPLQSPIFPSKGSNVWTFKIVGTFKMKDAKREGEAMYLVFHWKYFDEANDYVKGRVGWYSIGIKPGSNATQVAKAVDKLSENSPYETKTETEQAFQQSFMKQIGDIGKIVTWIMGAVFFTLLILTGNTMAQTVRERIPELAVLKTIGFTNRSTLMMVLAESLLMVLIGGLIGLGLAYLMTLALPAMSGGMMAITPMNSTTWILGLALMVVFGVLVGILPALRAMRLNIVDALAGR